MVGPVRRENGERFILGVTQDGEIYSFAQTNTVLL